NPAADVDHLGPAVEAATATLAAGKKLLPGVAGDIADPNTKEVGYSQTPAAGLLSLIDGLRVLKPLLPQIRMPALLLHSPQDHVVPPGTAKLLRERLSGAVEYVTLDRSYHVATLDYDGPEINRRAVAFAQKLS